MLIAEPVTTSEAELQLLPLLDAAVTIEVVLVIFEVVVLEKFV